MAVLQEASDDLAPSVFGAYVEAWEKGEEAAADQLEQTHPSLSYLRKATVRAMDDVHRVRVKRGLAVWYLYNMGYVFKTQASCFGIDIHNRGAELLADDLDFLLSSHEHRDHNTQALIKAMMARGKPVITRWFQGSKVVNSPAEYRFGDIRVKVDVGDHHYPAANQLDNMLMFQVDCGLSANGFVIYHAGDGNNYKKMRPDKPVDLFIVHVQVGMPVKEAIAHLKPRLTFVSHVMELAHSPKPPKAWRWSYEYAFGVIKGLPENKATVLTWGERWFSPGTALEE
jgi:L-ascorbate metabolism protein UlaG (beta-lactamase superfamily)